MLLRLSLAFAALLCAQLAASPSHAGNVFYVAGSGTGTACSFDLPCHDLATAYAHAIPGDVIMCLSSPAPATLTITQSITIDCSAAPAPSALIPPAIDAPAITINIPVTAGDSLRTVRLRGLIIDGAASASVAGNRIINRGIEIQAAATVHIEDCIISNVKNQGIFDHRTGGQTKLFIKNTIVNNSSGAGIVAVSAAVGITVLDNVTSENNTYGIAVGAGNNVTIKNSIFSGNSVAGVEADSGARVVLNGSTVTHNNIGVQGVSSVYLSNNDIAFNNTALSGTSGTFGNNRFSGNVAIGTALNALGGASPDLGQQ